MPHTRVTAEGRKPIQTLRGFTNRAMRFRKDNGIKAWRFRTAGKKAKEASEIAEHSPSETRDKTSRASTSDLGADSGHYREDSDKEEPVEEVSEIENGLNVEYTHEVLSTQELFGIGQDTLDFILQATGDQLRRRHVPELIPLFARISDEEVAELQSREFTSPRAVLVARALGSTLTGDIEIWWFPVATIRARDSEGTVHQNVAGVEYPLIHALGIPRVQPEEWLYGSGRR